MTTSPLIRAVALGAGVATLAFAFTAAPSLSLVSSSPASAAVPQCVPTYGDYPNLGGGASAGTDSAVSVYAAGDFTVTGGASEGEGKFVVGGDATFSGGQFNLGVVGSGSQVRPPAGSDMLITGGDVSVTSGQLDVGFGVGGNIVSGGTVGPIAAISTSGGAITENATAPLAPYAATAARFLALSADAAASPDTGTVAVTGYDVTFTGNNTDDVQVFTASGTDLGALGATKTMVFDDIPADAVVIVNVTGTTPVLSANTFELNGTPIVPDSSTSQVFSRFTQSLLWNFPAADNVTLGDGDQLLGSVIVPKPGSDVDLLTSTNGRLYAGGDIDFGGADQSGLELHNYGIRAPIDCVAAATGTLSISKTLTDADDVVDGARLYTGDYECRDDADAVTTSGTWSLEAGDTFVSPAIPTGSDCTVTEDDLDTAPSATDASYRWNAPVVSPSSVTIGSATTPVGIEVHNSVRRLVGDLAVRKVLDDPDAVVADGRSFTGTFSCELDGADITPRSNTWAAVAGEPATVVADDLPAGATCSVDEDDLTVAPVAGTTDYSWASPTFSATSVTISSGATATIVVTNRVNGLLDENDDDDSDDSGSGSSSDQDSGTNLASTGIELGGPLALGGGLLGLGAGLFVLARRRRSLRKNA